MGITNQKIIQIKKEKKQKNFLMLGIDDWQEAYKNLSPASFGMYLYLSSNANDYKLELSKVAVENAIGIKKSAYYKALTELEQKGYLIQDVTKKDYYYFFPHLRKNNSTNEEFKKSHSTNEDLNSTSEDLNSTIVDKNSTSEDETVHKKGIEIDNIDNTNTNKYSTDRQSEFSNKMGLKELKEEWGIK